MAINAFADAVEIVPRTLAESAGIDAIDTLVGLRASGDKNTGIAVMEAKTANLWKKGIIEPLKIKTQAVKSASEAAEMILRIDDIISTKGEGGGGGMPPGMPEGMGGMPPMM